MIMIVYSTLDMQEVTDAKFHDHFADEDNCFPDQVSVSGNDRIKQSTSKYIFNMDIPLQQDSVLDRYLREEQQKKVMSGSARYNAMQVCRRISVLYYMCTLTDG